MKTSALYGFISALSGAFLTLILFFLGWHSDAAKLSAATWVGGLAGMAIYIVCITLGTKARREETPSGEPFGYGRALRAGLGVAVFSTLFSAVFNYCYNSFINPAMADLMLQDRLAKMEASGMSGDKLDKAEAMTRMMFNPVPMAIYFIVMSMVLGLIISLIVAAILKREAVLPPKI